MEIWHCFLGIDPHLQLIESLNQAGLRSKDHKSFGRNGPGIVFFKEFSAHLLDSLREKSCQGVERVLAISLSRRALEPNVIWNLLAAGAADVFAWARCRNPAQEISARFQRWKQVDTIVDPQS